MGIFDSITDSIVDLGDWAGSAGDDLFNFASSQFDDVSGTDLLSGVSSLFKSQDARKAQAFKNINSGFLDMGKVREKENNVEPGKAQWGLKNYAGGPADPTAIEEYWHGVLQKFVQASKTGVGKAR